ncbi:hypothetical protein M0805_007486 [Coniferiporia weirii]|nr:hypothetical protein M0805_007486 [Coniferiporia weirii]
MAGTPKALTAVFLIFHITGGIIGLPAVFLSIMASHQLSRHPTLLNFCATWFFSSLIYTLLFYAGKQGDEHPSLGLCLAQASMVNGAFPMTSVSGVALVAHRKIWHGLRPSMPWSQFGLATRSLQKARLTALLVAPYIVFLAFAVADIQVGHANTDRIKSTDALFYCTLNSGAFNVFIPIITIVAMGFILLFEALICLKIYNNAYIQTGISHSGPWLFWLRLAGFSIYAIIALVVSGLLLSNNQRFTPYILQASLPLVVFMFIGTQKEILMIWTRWLHFFSKVDKNPFNRRYSRSETTLFQNGHLPTSSFATPEFVQLRDLPYDKRSGPFVVNVSKSSAPFAELEHYSTRSDQTHSEPQVNYYDKSQRLEQLAEEPFPAQEPAKPYKVHFPAELPRPHSSFIDVPPVHCEFSRQNPGSEQDTATIDATQKQTIARLTEEAIYMNSALDRLKAAELTLHKTQNLLVTERRVATQLRSRTNQMEMDLDNQTNTINNILVANRIIEDKFKHQGEELNRLTKETESLSDALQHSVKNEIQWKGRYDTIKVENDILAAEVNDLKNERDVLLDIWSTLESPIDWEIKKGRTGPSRRLSQYTFPGVVQKMRQRSSTPAQPPLSKSTLQQARRRTDAVQDLVTNLEAENPGRAKLGVPIDNLDRLRHRMLELSGNMELSEKVSGLEKLVREQATLIEHLEAIVEERCGVVKLCADDSVGNWSIPNSISSSMITEREGALSRDSGSEVTRSQT